MKNFFLNLIQKDTPESSKRFCGVVGFMAAAIVICVFKQEFLCELVYTSAGLMGLGILDKIGGKRV